MTPDTAVTAVISAILSVGGAAFIREIFNGITKLRAGVAPKESTRKHDAVAQRNESLEQQQRLETRATSAERAAAAWESYATDLREFCIAHGTTPRELPPRPVL